MIHTSKANKIFFAFKKMRKSWQLLLLSFLAATTLVYSSHNNQFLTFSRLCPQIIFFSQITCQSKSLFVFPKLKLSFLNRCHLCIQDLQTDRHIQIGIHIENEKIRFQGNLGSTRFFKVAKCNSGYGPLVVKVRDS